MNYQLDFGSLMLGGVAASCDIRLFVFTARPMEGLQKAPAYVNYNWP